MHGDMQNRIEQPDQTLGHSKTLAIQPHQHPEECQYLYLLNPLYVLCMGPHRGSGDNFNSMQEW